MAKGKKKGKKAEQTLTQACEALLTELEQDLWKALEEDPAPGEESRRAEFQAEWSQAKKDGRTAQDFDTWVGDRITQIGASWVLSCVFVRFLEDNDLVDRPYLSGAIDPDPAKDRRKRAADAEKAHYAKHPDHGARDYLKVVFLELSRLPGMGELLDARHALLWRLTPRIEGGRRLLEFFRELDDAGQLRWSLADPTLDTRFLGDLYQDLSEHARKTYALLQTPEFIESFILDRTLEPAIETFGLAEVRMIDPTCGSGHFLLGAFRRLLEHWQRAEPATEVTELVRRSLDAVHGVDLNPFAVAIARLRLLIAAVRACGLDRLTDAPRFPIHVAVGDSLLHGPRFGRLTGNFTEFTSEFSLGHLYSYEISDDLRSILGQQYHAVVGNPPYITPKDKALNAAYRQRFASCHREYALTVPFMERLVELAMEGQGGQAAGFVGQITSNSFMKREFGKKLIEEFLPRWDLTHVINTSGAYIPGHGTPTVILLLRHQAPRCAKVRAVLGIRGEPTTPADPVRGLVWSAIAKQLDHAGSESEFVSVEDRDRNVFGLHPWSLGGGGAAELKASLESASKSRLREHAAEIGFVCITRADDLYVAPSGSWQRHCGARTTTFVEGDRIRDWCLLDPSEALFPYQDDPELSPIELPRCPQVHVALWPHRTHLFLRREPNGNHLEIGLTWHEWSRFQRDRYRSPLSIAFAFVATHNHFVLDRGGKVFKQSAPVIKLPLEATEDDHFALLALLNSSTACFWMKQVFYPKASAAGDISTEKMRPEANRYEFSATGLEPFPVPAMDSELRALLISLASRMDTAARRLTGEAPRRLLHSELDRDYTSLRALLSGLEQDRLKWKQELVLLQEELDWACYRLFGLVAQDPAIDAVVPDPGQGIPEELRPFRWIGDLPPTGLPGHCASRYQSRVNAVTASSELRLVEDPVYKRLWLGRQGVYGSARTSFKELVEDASDELMLDRVEGLPHWKNDRPAPMTVASLSDLMEGDRRFLTLLRVRTGDDVPDGARALAELIESQSVPFLPALYLRAAGLKKRKSWEETWRLQRIEDPFLASQEKLLETHFGASPEQQRTAREHVACWLTCDKLTKERDLSKEELAALAKVRDEWRRIDQERQAAIGDPTPPVPPKYTSADFQDHCWQLRGKLDVPKERFISYSHCSPDGDRTLLVGWAGWDHAQRAAALVQVLGARKSEGWTGMRLAPMLLGLEELLPWLKQWHGEDHEKSYRQFIEAETLAAGLTAEQVQGWSPPEEARRRGRPKKEREPEPEEEEG